MKPKKTIKTSTFTKYMLSYLCIIATMLLCFLFIVRAQLTDRFFNQRVEQLQTSLSQTTDWLNDRFQHLITVESSLGSNVGLVTSLYTKESPLNYLAYQELMKFDNSMPLINSIVYKAKISSTVISTKYSISFDGKNFYITTSNGINYITTVFDPSPWLGSPFGQFLLLCDDKNAETSYIIYFPPTPSLNKDVLFFILDKNEILQYLKAAMTSEISAIALIDANGQLAVNVNGELLLPYLEQVSLEDSVSPIDSTDSIFVNTGIYSNFSLVTLVSRDTLVKQVNEVFTATYLALLVVCLLSFLLIYLAMKITYTPLHQLVHKLAPESTPQPDYLLQLESVFSTAQSQNHKLDKKLNDYRLFMQKSLLDTLFASHQTNEATAALNIDQLFDPFVSKELFIIQMMQPSGTLPYKTIHAYFQEVLPEKESCILLDAGTQTATFLINYTGLEANKDEILLDLLKNYYEEYGYLSAISNASESPLDIPSLYENALYASTYWPETPVATYSSLPIIKTNFTYPHEPLRRLTLMMNNAKWDEVRALLAELFLLLDNSAKQANALPTFFMRCILIDMLTSIANCMNRKSMPFDSYENLYTETLYLCRSCTYTEQADKIKGNFYHLVDTYEQHIGNQALTPAQVIQLMEEAYTDPDFSISLAADKCHVSIACMSYLIKKELNQNFSDYLWTLRYNKATELLRDSDMSIDEVSVAVGYLAPNSFRRKFKQETGMTPLQYRKQFRT